MKKKLLIAGAGIIAGGIILGGSIGTVLFPIQTPKISCGALTGHGTDTKGAYIDYSGCERFYLNNSDIKNMNKAEAQLFLKDKFSDTFASDDFTFEVKDERIINIIRTKK